MPVPLAISIGAQALPFVLSLFNKGPDEIDTQATLRGLIAEFERSLGPAGEEFAQQATRSGAVAGAALSQDVASSIGTAGGGSTGVGRVTRGLAASASSRFAGEGGASARLKVAQLINQLATQALPSALGAQTQTKARTGLDAQITNMLSGLSGVTATEGNPFMNILNRIFKESGPGESPITAEDFAKIANSPLLGLAGSDINARNEQFGQFGGIGNTSQTPFGQFQSPPPLLFGNP